MLLLGIIKKQKKQKKEVMGMKKGMQKSGFKPRNCFERKSRLYLDFFLLLARATPDPDPDLETGLV